MKYPALVACIITGLLASWACAEPRTPLSQVQARYGFPAPSYTPKTAALKSAYSSLVFTRNSRKLYFNRTLIWMNSGARVNGSNWSLADTDVETLIAPLLAPRRTITPKQIRTVVIDPGHGGSDTGAQGKQGTVEKLLVLDIAKRIERKLKRSGLTIRLTRQKDQPLTLSQRSALARSWDADLFVSIHLNAAGNSTAEGAETYIIPPAGYTSTSGGSSGTNRVAANAFDCQNTLLAYHVQRTLLSQTSAADRGIKHARFAVLQTAPCPAILVECGFVSNQTEAGKLMSRSYRDKLADGIALGIQEYMQAVEP